ncbi:YfcE family phosphodiesterase [Catenisphaera adipataccumulans]|jgi:putative phosphoesterase|uniref:Phosphoesterase n=1 Tax=Catenisphaera adipataccumulans TaxID=700500 RepID=A0A7W8FXD8_9FIRM|nr:YfcE family phosphodiesterase [Catenisphaera adipataccumulans]MBB5183610.1 hypothetical protein [Catenisphaera adipataccumulans]
MKIIVASDSHGRNDILDRIQEQNPDADLYLHCGDLEDDPIRYPMWTFVQGNNDFFGTFARQRVIPVLGHKILLIHSDRCSYFHREAHLSRMAKMESCDIVCYGHTHVSHIEVLDQVFLLNPGSVAWPRDGRAPSYAVLDLDYTRFSARLVFEDEWA